MGYESNRDRSRSPMQTDRREFSRRPERTERARPTAEQIEESLSVFLGNIPYAWDETELRDRAAPFGETAKISIPTDRESGRPRGFAFVSFVDKKSVFSF